MAVAETDPDLRRANGVTTMQMGPEQVVAMLSAEFEMIGGPADRSLHHPHRNGGEAQYPELVALFIKPQTPEVYAARRAALVAGPAAMTLRLRPLPA